MQVYSAAITTAYNRDSQLFPCGIFYKEEDAVKSMIRKIFQHGLLNRENYLEWIQEDIVEDDDDDDDNDDEDNNDDKIEKIQNMSYSEFEEMIYEKIREQPTTENLGILVNEYSSDYTNCLWDFHIDRQTVM